jgi:hypothetical protein
VAIADSEHASMTTKSEELWLEIHQKRLALTPKLFQEYDNGRKTNKNTTFFADKPREEI